jgi:hypothetical protein
MNITIYIYIYIYIYIENFFTLENYMKNLMSLYCSYDYNSRCCSSKKMSFVYSREILYTLKLYIITYDKT